MSIDLLTKQQEASSHRHMFFLWRRMWEEFADPTQYEWQMHRLVENERANIPETSGVYTLIIQPDIAFHPSCAYLMYVGRSISLNRRFGEYLNERHRETGRPKIFYILNMYHTYVWFCFTEVPDDLIHSLEEALITAFIPPSNDQLPSTIQRVISAFR